MPSRSRRPKIREVTPDHLQPKVDKLKSEVSTLSRVVGLERTIKRMEARRDDLRAELQAATADVLIKKKEVAIIADAAKHVIGEKQRELDHNTAEQRAAIQKETQESRERIAKQQKKIQEDRDALALAEKDLAEREAGFTERETSLSTRIERYEYERRKLDEQIQVLGEQRLALDEQGRKQREAFSAINSKTEDIKERERSIVRSLQGLETDRAKLAQDKSASQRMAQEAARSKQEAMGEWDRIRAQRDRIENEAAGVEQRRREADRKERITSERERKLREEDKRIQGQITRLERMKAVRMEEERRLQILREQIQKGLMK